MFRVTLSLLGIVMGSTLIGAGSVLTWGSSDSSVNPGPCVLVVGTILTVIPTVVVLHSINQFLKVLKNTALQINIFLETATEGNKDSLTPTSEQQLILVSKRIQTCLMRHYTHFLD